MGASQWDMVYFNKNKVWNICIRLIATGFHHYLNFFKLAHDAFCKQTLRIFSVQHIIVTLFFGNKITD